MVFLIGLTTVSYTHLNLDDIDKKIIERYLELSDNQRQVIKELSLIHISLNM